MHFGGFSFARRSQCYFKIISSDNPSSEPKSNNKATIDLISCNFHDIPRQFKISTNNGTYSFNTDLLKIASPIIKTKLEKDPNQLEFHINIDDPENTMKKFEDIFRMITVDITESDLPFLTKIFGDLNLQFPKQNQTIFPVFPRQDFHLQLEFDKLQAANILQNIPKSMTIISNGHTYKCNPVGVFSSTIIKEIKENDPTFDHFKLDLDESEDFSILQRLFDFEQITIDYHNMDFLKKMSDELQIDCIRKKVEEFIEQFTNKLDFAESNEHLIEPISDLFTLLYSIELKSSTQVCQHLLNTEWVHGQSNILEMISCILQVIRTNLRLHPYILDLILLLDKQLNDANELNQFLSFFNQQLLQRCNESPLYCAFLYKLYEKKIISFEQIIKNAEMTNQDEAKRRFVFRRNNQQSSYFSPSLELIFRPEFEENGIEIGFLKKNSKSIEFDSNQYNQMRQNFEPLNDILRLIIHDDVDALQLKISQENININEKVNLVSLTAEYFTENQMPEVSLLNYAAENDSINCFKYLLLNNAELSSDLLISAVKGGNTEIIRIAQSKMPDTTSSSPNKTLPHRFTFGQRKVFVKQPTKKVSQLDIYIECLVAAITMHRYSIVEWIFEQIKDPKLVDEHLPKLLFACAQNCNIPTIVTLMNQGNDIISIFSNLKQKGSENSTTATRKTFGFGMNKTKVTIDEKVPINVYRYLIENGFYHFIEYLFKLTNQSNVDYSLFDDIPLVMKSRNPSILKVFSNLPADDVLYSAIQSNCIEIIDYIWTNLSYFNQSIDFYNMYLLLAANNSSEMFTLITTKYPLEESKKCVGTSQYLEIVCTACSNCNSKVVEVFTDLLLTLDPDIAFTTPFIFALSQRSAHICELFLNKNVTLNLLNISTHADVIDLSNGMFVPILFEKADKLIRRQVFYSFLFTFISTSLNENHKPNLLKLLSSYQSDELTSLLKRNSQDSPIVYAVYQGNDVAFNTLLEYLGDDISAHIEQINHGIQLIIEECSRSERRSEKARDVFSRFQGIQSLLSKISSSNQIFLNEKFLTLTIEQSDINLIKFCLEHMKDQTIFEEVSAKNPFILAIQTLNLEIVNLFIDYFGENICKQTEQINFGIKLILGNSKISNRSSFDQKSSLNDLEQSIHIILKRLSEIGNIDLQLPKGTFLASAVKNSNVEFVKFCLEHMKDQTIFEEVSAKNPFILAIQTLNLEIVNLFIDYFGENICKQTEQINFGIKLIFENSRNSKKRTFGRPSPSQDLTFDQPIQTILARLSEIESINILFRNGTLLQSAINSSNVEFVKSCLQYTKDQTIFEEVSAKNPFILAIQTLNLEIVNLFIDYFGENICKQTEQINFGIKFIIENYNNNNDNNGRGSSHSRHFEQKVESILKRLSEIGNIDLLFLNKTFLASTVAQSNVELVKFCLQSIKDQTIFEEVTINNPFILAIVNHNLEVFNLFVDYFGENISKQTEQIKFGIKLLLGQRNDRSIQFICDLSQLLPMDFKQYANDDSLFEILTYSMETAKMSLVLQYFNSAVNVCDSTTGNTLLMFAIIHNQPQIAEMLLTNYEIDVTIKNHDNETALSLTLDKMQQSNEANYYNILSIMSDQIDDEQLDRAFYFCNDQLAGKLILNEKLNVNYFHVQPKGFEFVPIEKPRKFRFTFARQTSSNKSNQNASNCICSTSLIHSIEMDQYQKFQLILNHPHFDPQLSEVNEAIAISISKRHYESFNQLLAFVDINLFKLKGRSLLSFCCENNFQEGVDRILNDAQFDFTAIPFSDLLLTVLEGHNSLEIIRALVDYDSKHSHILSFDQLLPNGKSFFTQINSFSTDYKTDDNDQNDTTQAERFVIKKNAERNSVLVPLILFLIEKGVDMNKPDLFGVYPLQHAIQSQSLPYVETLLNSNKLDFSVKINTKHIVNGTYFHLAIYSSDAIVGELVSRGIFNVNSKDDLGRTPYMIAQINSKSYKNRNLSKRILDTIKPQFGCSQAS